MIKQIKLNRTLTELNSHLGELLVDYDLEKDGLIFHDMNGEDVVRVDSETEIIYLNTELLPSQFSDIDKCIMIDVIKKFYRKL